MRKGVDHTGVTVVYFCRDSAGNVAMQKRNRYARDEHDRWDIGSGAIEFGQTAEEAVVREVKEEYGADVQDMAFLGYRDVRRRDGNTRTHWIALDFTVHVDPAQVTNNEPDKFDEVRWFPVTAMPENIHSQLPRFLALYKEKLGL